LLVEVNDKNLPTAERNKACEVGRDTALPYTAFAVEQHY
jgi:hypothetical protein